MREVVLPLRVNYDPVKKIMGSNQEKGDHRENLQKVGVVKGINWF